MEIALLVRYKADNVFEQWENVIMVTISVTTINVYPRFFCVCVVLFTKIFCMGPIPVQGGTPVTGDS